MKRFIAFILAVITVLPMALMAGADAEYYFNPRAIFNASDYKTNYVLDKKTIASKSYDGSVYKQYYTYSYKNDGTLNKIVYSDNYDKLVIYDSNMYSKSKKDSNGNVLKYDNTTFKYDKSNRLIKEVEKYSSYSHTKTYTYDKNSHLTKVTHSVNDDGYKNNYSITFSYDSKGQKIKSDSLPIKYNNKGYVTSLGYIDKVSYDSKGYVSKFNDSTYKNTYKDGRLVKTVCKNLDFTVTYTYKKLKTKVISIPETFCDYEGYTFKTFPASQVYNGKTKKPLGTDPHIWYKNNKNPGKAQIITADYLINFDIQPKAPTNLKKSSVAKTSATFSWSKVTGAKSYVVYSYNDSTKKYTKLTTVTSTKATIKNLKAGTTYKFAVKAVANGSVYSAYSSQLKVTTKK